MPSVLPAKFTPGLREFILLLFVMVLCCAMHLPVQLSPASQMYHDSSHEAHQIPTIQTKRNMYAWFTLIIHRVAIPVDGRVPFLFIVPGILRDATGKR